MEWFWVLVIVISAVLWFLEKFGKSLSAQPPMTSRPSIPPESWYPEKDIPESIPYAQMSDDTISREGMDIEEAIERWGEGTPAEIMESPEYLSTEGDSDWSEEPVITGLSGNESETETSTFAAGLFPERDEFSDEVGFVETIKLTEKVEMDFIRFKEEDLLQAVVMNEVLMRRVPRKIRILP
jgi:hypothetical protein